MKQFIAWARVSSARQKEEGWSLDTQQEKLAEYAARQGGQIVKLYVVTETASPHQERRTFNEMLAYARQHATSIAGVLVMKIDRAATEAAADPESGLTGRRSRTAATAPIRIEATRVSVPRYARSTSLRANAAMRTADTAAPDAATTRSARSP